MPDYAVAVLILVLFTGAITVAVVKARRDAGQIAAICQRRGWVNRPRALAFGVISGSDRQVPWEIELAPSTNDESRSDNAHVTFKFKLTLPRGEAHLIPRPLLDIFGSKAGKNVTTALAGNMKGATAGNPVRIVPKYDVQGLPDHVAAGDRGLLDRFLSPDSIRGIAGWPKEDAFELQISNGEITVTFSKYSSEKFVANLEKIHVLGVGLINAARRALYVG